jgi:CheY-like chemotaxis protein
MAFEVLIIEDDPDVRELTAIMLELRGWVTRMAPDGRAGLEAARQQHPDVIVCDIMMLEMDGFQVLQALRADEVTRRLPFVFVTALRDPRVGDSAAADGRSSFVRKPFTFAELERAIEQARAEA